MSCLTPERRVAQKKGCSRQDGKILPAGWRFFRIDANVPLPHVYFGKQLQLTHKTQVRIRWKWPPRYSGKPQDNIVIKNAVFSERHHNENRKKQENGSEGKEIAMQSRNRIMSGISSSRRVAEAQGEWRSLSPWIEPPAGDGMTVFSRKMRTTVLGCTSCGDTAIRCPASQSIVEYFGFSLLALLCSKNYDYFCAQNYELELRRLHNDPYYGGVRRCTFQCWHR